VRREHHAWGALEDIDVASELLRRAWPVWCGGHVEDDAPRRHDPDRDRPERADRATDPDVERQLAANRSADGDRHPGDEGADGAQQDPAGRRRAQTRHAAQVDPSGPCVKGMRSNRWSDFTIALHSTRSRHREFMIAHDLATDRPG
jgi:hypothetical protein